MSTDPARAVLADPGAPADERFDAQAELQRAHGALASELIPSADIQGVIDYIHDGFAEQDMMKAARNNVLQFPGRDRPASERGMRSVRLDDLQVVVQGDYYEKPGSMGFDALRAMVQQTPILSSVVMTRIRQIARFCQPSEDKGAGFAIRHMDPSHKLTPSETETTKLLAKFFQHCGWEFNPRRRKKLHRDNFTGMMAKLVRDSLTMDACPIETEMKRDRKLGIDGMYAVDGTTIRLCTESGYQGDDEITALQVIQGRIATAYTTDELIYEVRNPRTDVALAGYGLGETELLIRVVTGFLNAMSYNISGFDQNAIPKGLLHLSGNYADTELAAFKRYWNATVKGINNAWALPVMVSKDQESKASFETFGQEFNEMHFAKWMTFLVSIICSIYGMSPDEINFESFAAQKSSLSGSDTEEKLANSKDLGLHPNMAFFESMFTDFVVAEFDDKYCFRWVGLKEEDQDKLFEKQKMVLRVDELRGELGYDPDPEYGDAPLNPALVGAWQQAKYPPPEQPGADFGGGADQEDYGNPDQGGRQGGAETPPGQPETKAAPGVDPGADPAGGGDFGGAGDGDFGKALSASIIYNMKEE